MARLILIQTVCQSYYLYVCTHCIYLNLVAQRANNVVCQSQIMVQYSNATSLSRTAAVYVHNMYLQYGRAARTTQDFEYRLLYCSVGVLLGLVRAPESQAGPRVLIHFQNGVVVVLSVCK
jgi:hypothetical protein